jgi:hypothetical protein
MSDPAIVVAVAKAVAQRIDAEQRNRKFSQQFATERSYANWERELKDIDDLQLDECDKTFVDVVGHMTTQDFSLAARGMGRYRVPVDIALRRKFGSDKQDGDTGRIAIEEIDNLMLLFQELHLFHAKHRLVEFPYAVWDEEDGGTQILVAPDRRLLREIRQFTAIMRITFRADVKLL